MDSQGRKVIVCDNGTGVSKLYLLGIVLIKIRYNNKVQAKDLRVSALGCGSLENSY